MEYSRLNLSRKHLWLVINYGWKIILTWPWNEKHVYLHLHLQWLPSRLTVWHFFTHYNLFRENILSSKHTRLLLKSLLKSFPSLFHSEINEVTFKGVRKDVDKVCVGKVVIVWSWPWHVDKFTVKVHILITAIKSTLT